MEKRFTIGSVAWLFGLSCETLRNWERRGIFVPGRDYAGGRVYTEDDLRKLQEIIFPRRDSHHGT